MNRTPDPADILETLPNPVRSRNYTVRVVTPDLTFFGAKGQPDHGTLTVSYEPRAVILELKSFKLYVHSFRDRLLSYERFANVVYDDLAAALFPDAANELGVLHVTVTFHPRGGTVTTVEVGCDPNP